MPSTANKGLEVQTTGSNSGTWGDVLNNQMISYVDLMLGGTLSQALSAVDVTLTAANARNAIVRFTGLLLTNVIVTTPCLGFTIFDNQTTGSFTVTVQYTGGVGGTPTLAQGALSLVAIDATNGCRIVWADNDLAAIAALTATSGILKKTAANTWSLNTGVTDLAATTANRFYGTDGSGNSGLITTDASLALAAGSVAVVAATQANMEAQASSNPVYPNVQKYHPGHPKAWALFNGTTTGTFSPSAGFGVTSITRSSTGTYTVTLSTPMSSASYAVVATACEVASSSSAGNAMVASVTNLATGSFRILTVDNNNDNFFDCAVISFVVLGDQ